MALGASVAGNMLVKNPQLLANVAYGDRMGNGSPATGDGWKYRGSGYKQLTGR